jgi:hypothetical protein
MSKKSRKPGVGKSETPEGQKGEMKSKNNNVPEETKSEIENTTSEIEEMEVHHHPQLEHKPKPWKEYILEGLMIFLAVFMGFIAENIRENVTSREHARQLTSQLVKDLKSDTLILNEVFHAEKEIIAKNDTLFDLLQQPLAKTDHKKIQRLIIASYSLWPFYASTGAISAIKNELHIKQFTNSDMISHIAGYEGRTALYHKIEDEEFQSQKNYLESFCRLHFTPPNLNAAFNRTAILDGQMRNVTQNDFTQLSSDIVIIRTFNYELLQYNRKLKNDAVNLMKYVTKQFDLGDE